MRIYARARHWLVGTASLPRMRLASMVSQRPLSSAMSVVKVERSVAPTVLLAAGATTAATDAIMQTTGKQHSAHAKKW